jgi:HAD superfamily hydrolase (TIGR01549 family)
MIKNIVFDLGNVLISFKPADYLSKLGYTAEIKNVILDDVFRSKEWQLIDKGEISREEASRRISERSTLSRQEIEAAFDLRIKILLPIEGNTGMLPALKKGGFKLYFLSNFPDDIFDEVFDRYPFFRLFDGGFISSRVKSAKPDRRIFEILLEKYSLNPEECLFIDDDESNVRTAVSIGMSCIHLSDPAELHDLVKKRLPEVRDL